MSFENFIYLLALTCFINGVFKAFKLKTIGELKSHQARFKYWYMATVTVYGNKYPITALVVIGLAFASLQYAHWYTAIISLCTPAMNFWPAGFKLGWMASAAKDKNTD